MHPNFIPTFPQLFPNRPQLLSAAGWDGCGTATESWDYRNQANTLYSSVLRLRLRSVGMVAVILATSRIFTNFFSPKHKKAMTVDFRKIQQTYPDALKLTTSLKKSDSPCGPVSLSRALGGGRVLHYTHTGTRETIIVSREAAQTVTVIYGPPGSGKTYMARQISGWYKMSEVFATRRVILEDKRGLQIPAETKLLIIDEWPACVPLTSIFDYHPASTLPHVIICTQWEIGGSVPFAGQLPNLEYIKLPLRNV